MNQNKPNILFVCARNKFRSRTAETIFRKDERFNVRSAGLSEQSPHKLSYKDIEWADVILVMEKEHRTRIHQKFDCQGFPKIIILDIPDIYNYMDEELIEILQTKTDEILILNEF